MRMQGYPLRVVLQLVTYGLFNSPAHIVRLMVRAQLKFPLSFWNTENLLAWRGIRTSPGRAWMETSCRWAAPTATGSP